MSDFKVMDATEREAHILQKKQSNFHTWALIFSLSNICQAVTRSFFIIK